jgi:hypothetical protein
MTGRINTSAIEIVGRVDGLVRYDIAGWAWRPDAPDRTVIVAVVADGRVLARTKPSTSGPILKPQENGAAGVLFE